MTRRNSGTYLWLACILLMIAIPLRAVLAENDDDDLEVVVVWPNEGETLYAGPTSLLYKVPVKGYIRSERFAAQEIDVRLEVFKESDLVGSLSHTPQTNGEYEFFVTVNPDASLQEFTIGFRDCGELCHSEGEIALRPGHLRLQVTAVAPDGTEASTERHIIVDVAGMASVPVEVVLADDPQKSVTGVNISASTWVYLWRARFGSGVTGDNGKATLRVEALAEAPTDYVFRASPTIVDGVLYRGVDAVPLTLPPGAREGPPISLAVTAHRAQLSGTVTGDAGLPTKRLTAHAICLPDGQAFSTDVRDDGRFSFTDLPVDQYHVAVEAKDLSGSSELTGRQVDLTEDLETDVTLELTELPTIVLEGEVREADGSPLPFAWAAIEQAAISGATLPATGRYYLAGMPADASTLIVNAPGYYAEATVIEPAQGSGGTVTLRAQPETVAQPWGNGRVILPGQSTLEMNGNRISLQRGWLWGRGGNSEPLEIDTPSAKITVDHGDFALEYLPGQRAWFYLFKGQASLSTPRGKDTIAVAPGEMVNLLNEEGLKAVANEPFVVRTLRTEQESPVPLVWEPGFSAQLRHRLARLGIGTAQVITFVTYLLVFSSLLGAPLLLLYFAYRRRRVSQS